VQHALSSAQGSYAVGRGGAAHASGQGDASEGDATGGDAAGDDEQCSAPEDGTMSAKYSTGYRCIDKTHPRMRCGKRTISLSPKLSRIQTSSIHPRYRHDLYAHFQIHDEEPLSDLVPNAKIAYFPRPRPAPRFGIASLQLRLCQPPAAAAKTAKAAMEEAESSSSGSSNGSSSCQPPSAAAAALCLRPLAPELPPPTVNGSSSNGLEGAGGIRLLMLASTSCSSAVSNAVYNGGTTHLKCPMGAVIRTNHSSSRTSLAHSLVRDEDLVLRTVQPEVDGMELTEGPPPAPIIHVQQLYWERDDDLPILSTVSILVDDVDPHTASLLLQELRRTSTAEEKTRHVRRVKITMTSDLGGQLYYTLDGEVPTEPPRRKGTMDFTTDEYKAARTKAAEHAQALAKQKALQENAEASKEVDAATEGDASGGDGSGGDAAGEMEASLEQQASVKRTLARGMSTKEMRGGMTRVGGGKGTKGKGTTSDDECVALIGRSSILYSEEGNEAQCANGGNIVLFYQEDNTVENTVENTVDTVASAVVPSLPHPHAGTVEVKAMPVVMQAVTYKQSMHSKRSPIAEWRGECHQRPWSLAWSVWRQRPLVTESGSYFNSLKVRRRAIKRDWNNCWKKRTFRQLITKTIEATVASDPLNVKYEEELQGTRDAIHRWFGAIKNCFDYWAGEDTARTHTHTHMHSCTHTHTHMHSCTHTHTHTRIHTLAACSGSEMQIKLNVYMELLQQWEVMDENRDGCCRLDCEHYFAIANIESADILDEGECV
jgi:hypothetical protein